MNKEALVTIIIPVYNIKDYISKCLDSVINQTHSKLQIIVINDGSTDGSDAICLDYSAKDNRIEFISKENGGQSSARNIGIDKAKGEFIYFIDGDDFIEENAIEFMLNCAVAENLDIVAINAYDYKNGTISRHTTADENEGILDGISFACNRITKDSFRAAIWLYFYKTSIIIDNKLRFNTELRTEDELWTPVVLSKCKRIKYFNVPLYYYVFRATSVMNGEMASRKDVHFFNIIKICNSLKVYYSNLDIPKKQFNVLCDYIARQYMGTAFFKKHIKDYRKILPRRIVLKNIHTVKSLIKFVIYSISTKLYIRVKTII